MMDEAIDGSFKGLYLQGEDIAQSDPDTKHIVAGLRAMECVVVQDLFLNETARYAHVFLPGSSFLEKDGTFTNAERRISRVRKAIEPLAGKADWETTIALAEAMGVPMRYSHPSEIMDEIALHDADLPRRFLRAARRTRLHPVALQRRRRRRARPIMHVDRFVRGKGRFMLTEYVPTEERVGPRFPLLLTTGRILSQYNVGAQTRRTANTAWHDEDVLEIHPFDAEQRGVVDGDLVALQSRSGEVALARPDQRAHAAGSRLYDLPPRGHRRQCGDHRQFRLGDQLPGIQGDRGAGPAHQPSFGLAGPRSGRRGQPAPASRERGPMPPNEGAASIEVEARSFSYDSGVVGPAFDARGRRRGAGRDRHRRRALRGDDGDAARPRGFRPRISVDRRGRRTPRRHSRDGDRGGAARGWRIT